MADQKMPKNSELNQLKEYVNRCCRNCGRKYPATILDIKAYLLNHKYIVCEDAIRCRAVREQELKNKPTKK